MSDKKNNALFYRADDLENRSTGKDGTLEFTFSSESRIRRPYGFEILSHKPGSCNLRILNSVLFNHDPNRILGPVRSKKIEGGRGLATMAFDGTDEGQKAKVRVASGSLKGVSIGYTVEKMRKLRPGEEYKLAGETVQGTPDDSPTYVAEAWTPREISLTPIPADGSVGVGRSAETLEGIAIEQRQADEKNIFTGGRSMLDQEFKIVLKRAEAFGDAGIALAARMRVEGKTVDEITDALLKMAKQERTAGDVDIRSLSDDEFCEGLMNPSKYDF